MSFESIFVKENMDIIDGVIVFGPTKDKREYQQQTNDAFSEKWTSFSKTDENSRNIYDEFQKKIIWRWFCCRN